MNVTMRTALTLCALTLLPLSASAQLKVGARALGLGGAFTAVADDLYGTVWNPAGITQLRGFHFSLFNAQAAISGPDDLFGVINHFHRTPTARSSLPTLRQRSRPHRNNGTFWNRHQELCDHGDAVRQWNRDTARRQRQYRIRLCQFQRTAGSGGGQQCDSCRSLRLSTDGNNWASTQPENPHRNQSETDQHHAVHVQCRI